MKTFGIIALALLAACASNGPQNSAQDTTQSTTDNGKLIFQTGRDKDGKQIMAATKPLRPSCMACHGADGAGGLTIIKGVRSADLRHKALVTDQKPPYTLALLERAITKGLDNQGKPLNPVMPRWKLSGRDLHDVAKYVLTELK